MRSWQRGVLAALVLVAFCESPWETCAEGAIACQTEQMACGRAGHDHCQMKVSVSDCCEQSDPEDVLSLVGHSVRDRGTE